MDGWSASVEPFDKGTVPGHSGIVRAGDCASTFVPGKQVTNNGRKINRAHLRTVALNILFTLCHLLKMLWPAIRSLRDRWPEDIFVVVSS